VIETGFLPPAIGINAIHLAVIVLGGALGGVARFWVSGVVGRAIGETFPWGTLAVNVSGAVCIGILAAVLLPGGQVSLWAALVVGVLGSYTTVSSFSLQTLALVREGEWRYATWNVLGSVAACLGAAAAAFAVVRGFVGG
jgi:fluoride exporter